jgi:hypothetical protein
MRMKGGPSRRERQRFRVRRQRPNLTGGIGFGQQTVEKGMGSQCVLHATKSTHSSGGIVPYGRNRLIPAVGYPAKTTGSLEKFPPASASRTQPDDLAVRLGVENVPDQPRQGFERCPLVVS